MYLQLKPYKIESDFASVGDRCVQKVWINQTLSEICEKKLGYSATMC